MSSQINIHSAIEMIKQKLPHAAVRLTDVGIEAMIFNKKFTITRLDHAKFDVSRDEVTNLIFSCLNAIPRETDMELRKQVFPYDVELANRIAQYLKREFKYNVGDIVLFEDDSKKKDYFVIEESLVNNQCPEYNLYYNVISLDGKFTRFRICEKDLTFVKAPVKPAPWKV